MGGVQTYGGNPNIQGAFVHAFLSLVYIYIYIYIYILYIYIYIYTCYRLKIGDMQKMMRFMCSSSSSKHLVGMLGDMQANHGISSVHGQCFSG